MRPWPPAGRVDWMSSLWAQLFNGGAQLVGPGDESFDDVAVEVLEFGVRPEAAAPAPAFEVASVSRNSFYPTVRDGFQDSVTLRWRPNGRLPVEMYVLDSRDRRVMQWPTQTWRPYYGSRDWYGKDKNGRQLPEGRYRVRMIARGSDGRTATKTLPVRIISDVITRRTSQRWYGHQTDRRRKRGTCYINGYSYDGTLNMDCWDFDGGSSAHADWWFRLPPSAKNIRWGINGHANCCADPGIIKKSSRRQGRKFIATMDVTGFRSYTVNRAWVGYTYKKRR